jgi:hexosaminidase
MKTCCSHPAYGSGPDANSKNNNGEWVLYNKADFIEILKYAKSRHIRIIPEVNFPGSCQGSHQSDGSKIPGHISKAGKMKEAESID